MTETTRISSVYISPTSVSMSCSRRTTKSDLQRRSRPGKKRLRRSRPVGKTSPLTRSVSCAAPPAGAKKQNANSFSQTFVLSCRSQRSIRPQACRFLTSSKRGTSASCTPSKSSTGVRASNSPRTQHGGSVRPSPVASRIPVAPYDFQSTLVTPSLACRRPAPVSN